ncbi:hypothetical protein [Prevotella fusca]
MIQSRFIEKMVEGWRSDRLRRTLSDPIRFVRALRYIMKMTMKNPSSRFLPMCCCPARVVLLVSTRGAACKHMWCGVLNALQWDVGMEATIGL